MLFIGILLVSFVHSARGLNIGLLLPGTAPSPGFPDLDSSAGVVVLAVEEIYRRYGVHINVNARDTRCDAGVAMVRSYSLATDQPKADVLLGPTCARGETFIILVMVISWFDGLYTRCLFHVYLNNFEIPVMVTYLFSVYFVIFILHMLV